MVDLPSRATIIDDAITTADWQTNYGDIRDFIAQLPGGKVPDELTIASGSVTPVTGIALVDTESSAATDNLGNILQTNLADGNLLILSAYVSGRVVVVRHNQGGAGNILLLGEASKTLTNKDFLVLRRSGTTWVETGFYVYSSEYAYKVRSSTGAEFLEWDGTDLYVTI